MPPWLVPVPVIPNSSYRNGSAEMSGTGTEVNLVPMPAGVTDSDNTTSCLPDAEPDVTTSSSPTLTDQPAAVNRDCSHVSLLVSAAGFPTTSSTVRAAAVFEAVEV